MTRSLLLLLCVLVCALACERAPQTSPDTSSWKPPALPDATRDQGLAALTLHECHRCHVIAGLNPPPIEKQCVGCHQQIEARTYPAPADKLDAWANHITHLTRVPALDPARRRFDASWLDAYLQEPHDLRPRQPEQMPRLAIKQEDRQRIVAILAIDATSHAILNGADATRGKSLFASKACGACHTVDDAILPPSTPLATILPDLPPETLAAALHAAPDLAAIRGRLVPEALVAWLLDPQQVAPDALMPSLGLSQQDALDLAAFVLSIKANDRALATSSIPPRLPTLARHVSYEEVEQEVFKKVCWHCHSEGDYIGGDGGPGNTGGFGFAPRYLNLAEYMSISSGMLDREGKRVSVFKKGEDGTPLIIAAMHARHAEVAGSPVEGIRGMPLGLPPLSLEQIQLVESWIEQGRPRE